jgi:Tol biopolymer transport system component
MPDVRELFETTTRSVRVEPGALQRQHRRQRRHRIIQTATVISVVAVMVALAAAALTNAWRGAGPGPANRPPGPNSVPYPPQLVLMDSSTGRIQGVGLIQNVAPDSRGVISPDGLRTAFVRPYKSSEQIYVTDRVNQVLARRVTGPGKGSACICDASGPAWAPDGTRIAFAGIDQGGKTGIYTLNVATGDLRLVTRGQWHASPAWSPDGRMIAFVRGPHNAQSLWIVNVATGGLTHVSTLPAVNTAWSPDGQTVAFSRPGVDSGIWLVHRDGSGLRRLVSSAVAWDGNISWSPDAATIAFAAPRPGGQAPHVDVRVVDVATGAIHVIARGFDYPTWSPDGRYILALDP